MSDWSIKQQDTTLARAFAHGDEWTPEQAAEVQDLTDLGWSDTDIAEIVGRTLYAIWSVKHRIAQGDTFDAPRASRVIQPGEAGILHSRVYTFIDGDVPEGW